MVKSPKLEPFKAMMDNLEVEEKEVIISAIQKFLCDLVSRDPEDEDKLNEIIERVIKEFTGVIEMAGKRFTASKFDVTKLMKQPSNK